MQPSLRATDIADIGEPARCVNLLRFLESAGAGSEINTHAASRVIHEGLRKLVACDAQAV